MPRRSTAHASSPRAKASSWASPVVPPSPPRCRWRARPKLARPSWRCFQTPASATCRRRCSKAFPMAPTLKAETRPAAAPPPVDAARAATAEAPSVLLPDPFHMYRGGTLRGARIAYESWGRLNAARDNAILLFTGLSPSAHAAATAADPSPGWWQRMIGATLAIDTNRYFVLCVNSLGSCFGSTGPASVNPATGQRYRLDFPEVAVEDIARAGFETARALGIERLAVVMGASLGGSLVAAFAALFPQGARRLITISGSAAASPFAIALRSVQREAILRDPD